MWLDNQVSLYKTHADNTGKPSTYREILLSSFDKDLSTIIKLRKLNKSAADYQKKKLDLKNKLQCYTPSALLETKAKGKLKEIQRTGIMQLDFDDNDINQYDVEDLKQAIFELPFVCFCGLSCSGKGFYALVLIAEPERLSEYAQHCFGALLEYGIKADTSKGAKVENLRYLSYDANMLIRENPEPLKIKKIKEKPDKQVVKTTQADTSSKSNTSLIKSELNKILTAQEGNRWATIQKVSYTLGGKCDAGILNDIEAAINCTPAFAGVEAKYLECAKVCFNEGFKNPIK